MLFSPELFIIGGGVSRKSEKFLPLIEGIKAEIVPAQLQNNAGIVGAAMRAAKAGVTGRRTWDGRRAGRPGAWHGPAAGPQPGAYGAAARPPVHQPDLPHGGDDTRDERAPVQPAGLRWRAR